MTAITKNGTRKTGEAESAYAWVRLFAALAIGTVGSVGMWSVVVALPAVQAEFSVARADASLPFTFAMLGFGVFAFGVLAGLLAVADPIKATTLVPASVRATLRIAHLIHRFFLGGTNIHKSCMTHDVDHAFPLLAGPRFQTLSVRRRGLIGTGSSGAHAPSLT